MREGIRLGDKSSLELSVSKGRSEIRPRLCAALLDALAATDLQVLTEADVARRAGIPAAAFRDYYAGLDECVRDAFDWIGEDVYTNFARAFAGPGDPVDRLRRGIEANLDLMLANPGAMRLWFLEARRTAELELQIRCTTTRAQLVELVTRPDAGWASDVPHLHVEFLFGALAHAAHDELAAGGDCAKAGRKIRKLLGLFEPVPS